MPLAAPAPRRRAPPAHGFFSQALRASHAELAFKQDVIDKLTLSIVLRSLPERRMAREQADPTDKRKKRLQLTDSGRLILAEAKRLSARSNEQMLDALGEGRRAIERRPGPVLHVLAPQPARGEGGPTAPQLDELSTALERIGPVLEEVARAQAFVFIDEGFAVIWQDLSRRACALLEELRAPPKPRRRLDGFQA